MKLNIIYNPRLLKFSTYLFTIFLYIFLYTANTKGNTHFGDLNINFYEYTNKEIDESIRQIINIVKNGNFIYRLNYWNERLELWQDKYLR